MNFEPNHIYHIYNQGNNRQKIFFNRENYLFFLKKIHEHILPFADVLAWCLMPNHFHLMVYLHSEALTRSEGFTKHLQFTRSEGFTKYRTLNDSIGVLLRSYTRAINKERNSTGSLFRRKTKADDLSVKPSEAFTQSEGFTKNASQLSQPGEKEYLQTCFEYIHLNPVKTGLAQHPEKWEFSSYVDYCGVRNGKLINRHRAEEFGLHL